MNQTTPYQCGAADAHYEERRGSGYTPSRYKSVADKADYAAGYLSVNPAHQQARKDARTFKGMTTIVVDRPLNYEPDGNVLFALETPRKRS